MPPQLSRSGRRITDVARRAHDLSICLAWQPATAEPRLALLIGNQGYARTVDPLTNPHNDIALIKATLRKVGFAKDNITVVRDANRITMLRVFDEYADKLRRAGPDAISFFYYSGHGAANRSGRNFLIPTTVKVPASSCRASHQCSASA